MKFTYVDLTITNNARKKLIYWVQNISYLNKI